MVHRAGAPALPPRKRITFAQILRRFQAEATAWLFTSSHSRRSRILQTYHRTFRRSVVRHHEQSYLFDRTAIHRPPNGTVASVRFITAALFRFFAFFIPETLRLFRLCNGVGSHRSSRSVDSRIRHRVEMVGGLVMVSYALGIALRRGLPTTLCATTLAVFDKVGENPDRVRSSSNVEATSGCSSR